MGAHQAAATSARKDTEDNPHDSGTAAASSGKGRPPRDDEVLNLVEKFPVNHCGVAPVAESEAMLHQVGVDVIAEDRQNLPRSPRSSPARDPAQRIRVGRNHRRRDALCGPLENPDDSAGLLFANDQLLCVGIG